jgi:hypothetical protein
VSNNKKGIFFKIPLIPKIGGITYMVVKCFIQRGGVSHAEKER